MVRPSGPQPPRVEVPALPDPVDQEAAAVERGDTREQERFVRADFAAADLAFTTFSECAFEGGSFHEADLRSVHFVESTLADLDAPVLTAPRSTWRSVSVRRSRLGAVELYESNWRSVLVEDSKIGYLNARGSQWLDVAFRNCVIDELDLSYSTVERASFDGCRIATLQLSEVTLTDVDLRRADLKLIKDLAGLAGSWVNEAQLTELAPMLADHLRIQVG